MTKPVIEKQGEHMSVYLPEGTKELIDRIKDPYMSRNKFFLKAIDQMLKERQRQNERQ
jgi:metal-responsive CopG/Arc/MetJ family transcriptional regulator